MRYRVKGQENLWFSPKLANIISEWINETSIKFGMRQGKENMFNQRLDFFFDK